jgi:hypothetical protein
MAIQLLWIALIITNKYFLNMPTYAFSTNNKFWKTRYSFEPDCYGSIDNYFASFSLSKNTSNTDVLCWEHNKNQTRNRFYNENHPSSLIVVSNENPSMEKVYNAISLESNQNQFFSSVSTNIDLPDNSVTKKQVSVFKSFTPREEGLYSDIGRSIVNSTKQVNVVGTLGSKLLVNNAPASAQHLKNIGLIENIEPNTFYFASQINSEYISYGMPQGVKVAHSKEPYDSINFTKANATQEVFNPDTCYSDSAYNLVSIKYFNNSLYAVFSFSSAAFASLWPSTPGIEAGNVIYSVSDPSLNGDQIRGKYAMITLQTPADGKPFELYAVNTEYSHSKLDASS